jgi:hypothetical protein
MSWWKGSIKSISPQSTQRAQRKNKGTEDKTARSRAEIAFHDTISCFTIYCLLNNSGFPALVWL